MQGLQNTSNQYFREIVGNGVRLEVPRFQRDYAWERHHWADLWEDIEIAQSEGAYHYLGFVVLQRRGDNHYAVIDGQQRLTTLSLLVVGAMRVILAKGGPDAAARADVLRASFIGRRDLVTLATSNKLSLNRNNDSFYRTYLTELTPPPKTGLRASERALAEAADFFEARLRGLEDGAAVARTIEFVAGHLFFTVITVTEELNAYRVFETLNARGVQLSAADLLKNYLFSVVDRGDSHSTRLDDLEEHWSRILEQLGKDSLLDFLRTFWNSHYGQVRAPQLYRTIRSTITEPGAVFELLRALDASVQAYVALRDPNHELWERQPEIARHLSTLKLLRAC